MRRLTADENTPMKTLALALLTTLAIAGSVQAQTRSMDRAATVQSQTRYTAMPRADASFASGRPGQGERQSRETDWTAAGFEHRLNSTNQ